MRIHTLILLICLALAGCTVRTGQEISRATAPGQGHTAVPPHFAQSAFPSERLTSNLSLRLPLKPNSVRFAVIGDTGTGGTPQLEVAQQMEAYRKVAGFTFVIMLGELIDEFKSALIPTARESIGVDLGAHKRERLIVHKPTNDRNHVGVWLQAQP
jgi:hypothetical protein